MYGYACRTSKGSKLSTVNIFFLASSFFREYPYFSTTASAISY